MKRTILVACMLLCGTTSLAATRPQVQRATFMTPYAHPADPSYPIGYGHVPYRWGWFGADHYPPAPVMHRDYNGGWREWHYRW
jgi:hypothetical protein